MFLKAQQLLLVLGLFVGLSASLDCSKRPKVAHPLVCCNIPDIISSNLDEMCETVVTTTEPATTKSQASEDLGALPLHEMPCFISCALNVTGIFVDNKLNEDKVRQYFAAYWENNLELQNTTRIAFTACALKLAKTKTIQTYLPSDNCPARPKILIRCVYRTIFMSCPSSLWTATKDCEDLHRYFEHCG